MQQQFLQSPLCIGGWEWVFLALLLGTWFYSLHKSKDTIKATHQRAIKGTNNSTLLWRGCRWTRAASAALFLLLPQLQTSSFWCLCRPSEAEPSQQAGIWLISERWGSVDKTFGFLQWPAPVSYSVSFSSDLNPACEGFIPYLFSFMKTETLARASPSDNPPRLDAGFLLMCVRQARKIRIMPG